MKKKIPRTYPDIPERKYFVFCELEYNNRSKKLMPRLLSGINRIEGVLNTKVNKDTNVITVTGEFDPDRLLMLVGENVRIKNFQSGKCFSILYLSESAKKENTEGNSNSRANDHPNYNNQNGYCYGAPNGYYGGNGYQNNFTQPRIFGNDQLFLEQNREAVEKPVSQSNNSQVSTKKYKKHTEGVGGCCLM